MIETYPKILRIISGGPWCLSKAPFETTYENPLHPLSIKLREKYKLDSVVAFGKTEFEKFLMLKEWVKRQMIQHGWSFNCLKETPVNALEILEWVEKGYFFHCLYHAKVFIQCCEALGYPARLVGARKINHEFPGAEADNVGHEIAEVWSNEYRKWIMMDCDTNSYYEKDGIPLSIAEICIEAHKDGGKHVEMVFGEYNLPMSTDTAGGDKVLGTNMTPDEIVKMEEVFMQNKVMGYYSIVTANSRQDLFSNRYAMPQVLGFAPQSISPLLIYNNEPYLELDIWTDSTDIFCWAVNEVAISLKTLNPNSPFPPLTASFTHNMPNFDHYEVKMSEDTEWKRSTEIVVWELNEGINKIIVRAVNTMNIAGPSANATVLFET